MLNPLRRGALIVALGLLLRPDVALAQAQPAVAAPPSRTRAHVDTLASPKLEGRLTGSPGADAAAAYIEARAEARSAPGRCRAATGYPRAVHLHRRGQGRGHIGHGGRRRRRLRFTRPAVLALSFSDIGQVTAPVVFAGYGLRVPAENGGGFVYDSYAGLDVKDKIVLVLRYVPEKAEREQREQHRPLFAALRYKAQAARQAGAKALLVVSGPNSIRRRRGRCRSRYDTAAASSGIVAVSVSGAIANALVRRHRQVAASEAQDALDTGNPHVAGFALGTRRDHGGREADPPDRDDLQRRRLPSGHARRLRRRQAVGDARRALRSPRPRRSRILARPRRRGDHGASGRRRQRVRRRRRPGRRGTVEERPARAQRRLRALVGRGSRPARLGGVHRQAAAAARSARRLLQLRHGRPPARERAAGAGRRIEPVVGGAGDVGQHRSRR